MDHRKTFKIAPGSSVKRQSLLLVLLIIGGVIISFAVFSFVRLWEFNAAKADFKLLVEAHDATLQREIQLNLDIIEYIRGFYASSQHVSRAEFGTFSGGPLARRNAVRQLGWVPRVKAAEREPFEQGFRAEGYENIYLREKNQQGALTGAGVRAEYFPVQYLEPTATATAEPLLGVDLATDPVYREALFQARDSGEVAATGRLAMGDGEYYGVALIKPVYQQGAMLDSVADRREYLKGFLIEIVDISALLGEAVVSWGIFEIDITLLDEEAPPSEQILFHYDSRSIHEAQTDSGSETSMALYWRSSVNMPGRKWVLIFQPGDSFIASHKSWESWVYFFTGLTLTFLLCALQLSSISRTNEVEELAAGLVEVNAKLEKQIAERHRVEKLVKRSRMMLRLVLDTIPVRVYWKDRELNYMGCNRRFAEDAEMEGARDIVGKDDYDLIWRECADLYRSDDRQVMESGKAKHNYEEMKTGPDGKEQWLRISKIPLTDMDDKIIGVLGTYEDITQQKQAEEALKRESAEKLRIEQALVKVANAVSSSTGDEFFRILVKNLTRTLNMDVAFIAAFEEGDSTKAETLAVCVDDEIIDNFTYDMADTPCEVAIKQKGYYHPRGLTQEFHACALLRETGVESFLGTPLFDTSGKVLGIVAVLSRQPMNSQQPAESILRIFANRTAAELHHKQAEAEIRDLTKFPNENPSPVLRIGEDGRLMYANQGSAQILASWACAVGEQVPANIFEQCRATLKADQPLEVDIACGAYEYSVMFAPSVENHYVSIFAHDITERQHARAEMSKLSRAVEQTAESIFITDAQGIIEYVNPAFEKTTGYSRDEVLGKTPGLFKSGRHTAEFYENIWQTVLAGDVYSDIMINRRKDGTLYYEEKSITPVFDEKGKISHFISTGKDITERMQAEERLHHLAYHDVLTDLPNRALFMDRLTHALARRHREGSQIAVMFLDVDRFKTINDTLGHDSGDRLLQCFAQMLMKCVREGDTVARFGGDEFAILLEDIVSPKAASHVADKIKQELSRPFKADGQDLYVTTSIGISLYPDDGADAATLLKHADSAMYRAKEVGRNNCQFYAADMSARDMERLTMEHGLRNALARNEFFLLYQPQVDVQDGRILGAEALLRWRSPELGLVSPLKFIPLLEDNGLIQEVGEWVLRTACQTAKQWGDQCGEFLHIAVNISGRQFYEPELNILVARILEETGLDAGLLELEITESVLMQNDQSSLNNLEALRRLGVGLAIDDFGTGYSSLSYLKRFPVDRLKIDQSFIRDIGTDADDATIVSAITVMAHRLNLTVIAEGVETEEQLEFLRQCSCDGMQGFLFSKPLPAEKMQALLSMMTDSPRQESGKDNYRAY